jgi:hypothetical protein
MRLSRWPWFRRRPKHPSESRRFRNAVIAIVDELQDISRLPNGLLSAKRAMIKPREVTLMHSFFLDVDGLPFCSVAFNRSLAPYLTIHEVQVLMKFASRNLCARKLGYVLNVTQLPRTHGFERGAVGVDLVK